MFEELPVSGVSAGVVLKEEEDVCSDCMPLAVLAVENLNWPPLLMGAVIGPSCVG